MISTGDFGEQGRFGYRTVHAVDLAWQPIFTLLGCDGDDNYNPGPDRSGKLPVDHIIQASSGII